MRFLEKTWARVVIAASALVLIAAVGVHNLNHNLRTVDYRLPYYAAPNRDAGVPAADAGTPGVNGIVAQATVRDASVVVDASSLRPPPYAARLDIRLIDGADANSALTCTSVRVVGYDQFGNQVAETVTGIAESSTVTDTERLTRHTYERLLSVQPSGCTATGDPADLLMISTSDQVGLNRKIYADTNIISVCRHATGATDKWQCVNGEECETSAVTGDAGVNSSPVAHAVDLGSCGLTVAAGEAVSIRFRSPANTTGE